MHTLNEGCITLISGRQRRRQDRAGVGIDGEMQLPPGPTRLSAVLLQMPLVGPEHRQAGGVDDDSHRPAGPLQRCGDGQADAASGKGVW